MGRLCVAATSACETCVLLQRTYKKYLLQAMQIYGDNELFLAVVTKGYLHNR
jgi:hypothetical protein